MSKQAKKLRKIKPLISSMSFYKMLSISLLVHVQEEWTYMLFPFHQVLLWVPLLLSEYPLLLRRVSISLDSTTLPSENSQKTEI